MQVMRLFFACAILLILSQCNSVKTTHTAHLPPPDPVIHRSGYVLSYDGKTRNANWVYEELTPASIQGEASRERCDFMQDPLLPAALRATPQDYHGSGFDRGHLCPAADARANQMAMHETFYLSNISPQHPLLNRKFWLKLEKHVREVAKISDIVYVITGPLFLPTMSKGGRRYVKYEVIGENDVAVPTHFFKVLRAKKGGRLRTEAYIIPNQPISEDPPLDRFAVTLEKLERSSGIILTGSSPAEQVQHR
jgi:endonuclease G, mitochondrial